ncbi:MAG: hypothetical protein HZB46_16805, partial [Solirubrobacterales bacterium]|nr:hypothetical protein [Solirubrobacterales bacterium]
MLALVLAAPAPAATVVGKDPATGHGVLRFPQAIAVSPGGQWVWVGDQLSGVVQKFDRQGAWQLDVGWPADGRQTGRLGTVGGLAADRAGHLYVLDSANDRVQVFASDDGRWLGAWGSHGGAAGRFDLGDNTGAGGLAVWQPDATTPPVAYVADQYNHRVQRFALDLEGLPPGARDGARPTVVPVPTPAKVWGTHGDCASLGGCADPAYDQWLNYPQGIAVDPVADGLGRHDVSIADDDNHRVVRATPDGELLAQLGGYGQEPGRFRFPYDVGIDGATPRSLWVADNNNHRVQRFDADTLAFQNQVGGFGPQPGGTSFIRALAAVADDPLGGVYAADTAGNRVHGFTPAGELVASWGIAGRGPGYATRPAGVAVDAHGRVAIADTGDHRIEVLDAAGAYVAQFGYVSQSSGFAAPASGDGQFRAPEGVAIDGASGDVWVADTQNDRVQLLSADGTFRGAVGGFSRPRGIAVGDGGVVYVADTGSDRVRRREADGSWTTVDAGRPLPDVAAVAVGAQGHVLAAITGAVVEVTGPGAARLVPPPPGGFDAPSGLAWDAGRLYVGDRGGDRVLRRDEATGAWTVLASEGPAVGQVLDPAGLAVTPDGARLLVADAGGDRVQAFDTGTSHPSPPATAPAVGDPPPP